MKRYGSLSEIRADLSAGALNCEMLVQSYLARIGEHARLNAFLEVYEEEALAQARAVDAKLASGKAGALAGMVVGVKDVISHKGHKLRAASRILGDFEAQFTATALQRMLDEDAIVVGSLNCDEFAMGSSNENSAFGPVLNPLDPEYVPGGSSGGTAAAVAAGLCLAALGSDTGGSVRQPASFTGTFGLKPTYGRISRWGLIAYASSFDQIGPITHSAEDAARLLAVMAGADPRDNTSADAPVPSYEAFAKQEDLPPARFAVLRETIDAPGLDPEIAAFMQRMMEDLRAAGHTVEVAEFPFLDYLIPVYYILTTAEASSNLARYDGMRYGRRAEDPLSPEDMYVRSRSEGFGPEVKRRIMLGSFVLSAGYADAYYNKAQRVRRMIAEATQTLLKSYDFVLSPTSPTTPFKLGAKSGDPVSMYLSDLFTVHANLSGHPAVSIPLGAHSNGLPYGVQLLTDYYEETRLLRRADQLARAAAR